MSLQVKTAPYERDPPQDPGLSNRDPLDPKASPNHPHSLNRNYSGFSHHSGSPPPPQAPEISPSSSQNGPEDATVASPTASISSPHRTSFTYGASNSDVPLSMRFIHKPSRSQQLFEKAADPTRHNSITNRHLEETPDDALHSETTSHSGGSPPASVSTHSGTPTATSPSESPDYKLVRKKSGEVLKPSLKDSSTASYFYGKRSQSLPTTPTYKQVHFGCDTDVRYFKKKDKPNAISASNSPTLEASEVRFGNITIESDDDYDDDDDDDDDNTEDENSDYHGFDLNTSDAHGTTKYPRPEPVTWHLKLLNFAPLSYTNRVKEGTPVFLERLFITIDKKYLLGHIAVKNLAFEKHLTVRYSLDDWLTIIEIPTLYMPDRPDILKHNNYDRFTFQIPLDNLFNSFRLSRRDSSDDISNSNAQEKTYSLCIKYNTDQKEYWDNNRFQNYTIKLSKQIADGNPASKIKDHNARPKYSSSFLKRRVSDSHIEVANKNAKSVEQPQEESAKHPLYSHDNSSDVNDFVKNNYYLSSPLLSSLYNPSTKDDAPETPNNGNYLNESAKPTFGTNDASGVSRDSTIESPTPKYKSKFNSTNANLLNNPSGDQPDKTFNTKRSGKNIMDPKAYKELLDNYCFFSSPTSDDKQTSDSQAPSSADTTELNSTSKAAPYAVSSFLGK